MMGKGLIKQGLIYPCGKEKTFEDYFRDAIRDGTIDFSIRANIEDDDTISFYIHADGQYEINLYSPQTMDFVVSGNRIKSKKVSDLFGIFCHLYLKERTPEEEQEFISTRDILDKIARLDKDYHEARFDMIKLEYEAKINHLKSVCEYHGHGWE